MKKRPSTARPLLLRSPAYRISPKLLSRFGEAVIIASLVIIIFFHFWLGILALLLGGFLAVNGYRLSQPEQFSSIRAQGYHTARLFLKKISSLRRG